MTDCRQSAADFVVNSRLQHGLVRRQRRTHKIEPPMMQAQNEVSSRGSVEKLNSRSRPA